jgi:hypothetical protein
MDVSEIGGLPYTYGHVYSGKGSNPVAMEVYIFSDRPKCLGLSVSPTFLVFTILLNVQDLIFEQVGCFCFDIMILETHRFEPISAK